MSIVWQQRVADTLYQVRQAGRSLRLYTNGVFHSQYNPGRPVTGNVWDLLWLPAFFYPSGSIRRVLVLGVGGGAAIQQLRRFVQPDAITGVELNPVHLRIARRFFGVRGKDVELVRANALEWVQRYRGPAFDMIIEDLFGDSGGEAERTVFADPKWVSALTRCLSDTGMIVCNFATRLELMSAAYLNHPACRKNFRSAFQLSTAQNYNTVGVFLRRASTTRQLRERLKRVRELDPRRPSSRLSYRIKTLKF
jgi:spermidine synthase